MALIKKSEKLLKKNFPTVPLRDLIIFPQMVVPLLVGRPRSLNAVEEALSDEGYIVIVFQKEPQIEEPTPDDIYPVGVIAKIIQSVKEPSGVMKILVEVLERVKVKEFVGNKKYFFTKVERVKEEVSKDKEEEK